MAVYQLDPVCDSRWTDLVERHPHSSAFHTPGWLEALQRTYGYEPVAYTTSPPGTPLRNGVVFCQIRSWLTGRRLVSLPFSDHCDPLVEEPEQLSRICEHLREQRQRTGWRYIELRPESPLAPTQSDFRPSEEYCLHSLDLTPGADALFRSFQKDSIQRKIRRAERENLGCQEGSGERLLRAFYSLLLVTRRRHQIPPQPYEWFQNLAACVGEALKLRLAIHRGQAIAGILTLQHRNRIVYKYGVSDARFHGWGGMHLLFWRAIQEACARDCVTLDLGRSDWDNTGLLTFKDRWGAVRTPLSYWRDAEAASANGRLRMSLTGYVRPVFTHLPDGLRVIAGKILYKHVG